MTRHFMTLHNAAALILEAGRTPWTEIPIIFTGLRPGEKLSDELLTGEEELTATRSGGILRMAPAHLPAEELARRLQIPTDSLNTAPEYNPRPLK